MKMEMSLSMEHVRISAWQDTQEMEEMTTDAKDVPITVTSAKI